MFLLKAKQGGVFLLIHHKGATELLHLAPGCKVVSHNLSAQSERLSAAGFIRIRKATKAESSELKKVRLADTEDRNQSGSNVQNAVVDKSVI